MRLYLVRHGQTAWNSQKKAQGHADTALDERGLAQSRTLVGAFSPLSVSLVLSSDLSRCRQTATQVAAGSSAQIQYLSELRERHFGSLEGTDYDAVRSYIEAEALRTNLPAYSIRPEGGESLEDVWNRLDSVVERLRDSVLDTAVVSHGGTVGLLVARLIEAGPAAARNIRVNNCSVTELHRRADGGWSLVRVNDTRHMEGLGEGVVVGA